MRKRQFNVSKVFQKPEGIGYKEIFLHIGISGVALYKLALIGVLANAHAKLRSTKVRMALIPTLWGP